MEIRRAAPGDLPALGALLEQVLAVHHAGRPDLFRAEGRKYTDRELSAILADDERPVFVADEGGEVLGYAFCVFVRHAGEGALRDHVSLYIDDLCVDEARRGRGVGGALFRFVRDFARAHGCYDLTLNVWACNEDARRFYERMGMKEQKIGMETVL